MGPDPLFDKFEAKFCTIPFNKRQKQRYMRYPEGVSLYTALPCRVLQSYFQGFIHRTFIRYLHKLAALGIKLAAAHKSAKLDKKLVRVKPPCHGDVFRTGNTMCKSTLPRERLPAADAGAPQAPGRFHSERLHLKYRAYLIVLFAVRCTRNR